MSRGASATPGPPAGHARGSERVAVAAALLCIAVYCVARYRDALLSFFFLDDFWLLRDVAALHWRTPLDVVQIFRPTHVGFELYRPLTQSGYFALLWALFGCDATGYHAVQLLAYAGTALLVFGIARRLTGSIQAACGASLIYATAPGNALPVFWIAAFTMTGTALAVFLMLWVWLRVDPPRRRVGICLALQVIALLASEHAVVAPALLALVGWSARREVSWRRQLRLLVPLLAVVAAYVGLKIWYLAAHPVTAGYAVSADPRQWLTNVGRYALGSVNVLRLTRGPEPGGGSLLVGAVLVVLALVAAWRARRGDEACRLLAAGLGVFLVSLAPVVPLAAHFYDYFVGIAALGLALAVVAGCQLVSRRGWPSLALAVGAGLVLFDVVTGQEALRYDPIFGVIDGGARVSARWIEAVAAARPGGGAVAVPSNAVTDVLFGEGHIERIFPGMPLKIAVFPARQDRLAPPGAAVVTAVAPFPPDDYPDLPGWEQRWAWLRALARWHLGPHRPGSEPPRRLSALLFGARPGATAPAAPAAERD